MTNERILFLSRLKRKKRFIFICQISLLIIFLTTWELLAKYNIINTFIFSSPSLIIKTLINLYQTNNLFIHIEITSIEVIVSFFLCLIISFITALILYCFDTLKKILDPFITMLNSMPKVALGPLIIIWMGANVKSIIFMSLLINVIVSMITIYNGMVNTDKDKIKLFKIMGASKIDTLKYLIIPSSLGEIISSMKINISMSLIGVIMGEFLSSKRGIGYLILYGSQVFNLSLVMCGLFILLLLSFIFFCIINLIDKHIIKASN